jgi:hypothetical protein
MDSEYNENEKNTKKYQENNFVYNRKAKDISLDTYINLYKTFCNEYGFKIDKDDIDSFSNAVKNRIYDKVYSQSVDYRPKNGTGRIFITPIGNQVSFFSYSYSEDNDANQGFIESIINKLKKPKIRK